MSQTAATLAAPSWTTPALPRWRFPTLAVDLGDQVFTARWWRGLATLALLCGLAVHFGTQLRPICEPVRAPLFDRQQAELAHLQTAPLAMGGAGSAPAPFAPSVERLAEPPERPIVSATARVTHPGGVKAALRAAGVGPEDTSTALSLAAREARLTALPTGTIFDLVLGRRETKAVPRPLTSATFRAAFDLKLKIARAPDGHLALTRLPIAIDTTPLDIRARVGSSLQRAAQGAGAPAPIIGQFVKLLSYRLDFERDVHGADHFDLLLDHKRAATGETITGGLIYARLDREDGAPIELLRWQHPGLAEQYFLADGSSAKKGLIRTPVEGAHITSGFGFRFHPILGYSRMHQGIDFGVPAGSPILAAAAGRVEFAGWHGGHGNYVRLAHSRNLATAYGHMSRIGVHYGQMVAQGQVIGLSGSTGLSTGPHLHFETWINGQAVDPHSAHLPTGIQLAGAELARFRSLLARARGGRAGSDLAQKAPTSRRTART